MQVYIVASHTTVKISRDTLSNLGRLREEMKARSIDETVMALIKSHRKRTLAGVFGADKGRVRPFTDEDRGEDR